MVLNRPFAVEAELRAIVAGKPTTHADTARLLLAVIADLSERFDALEAELDEIHDCEMEAAS